MSRRETEEWMRRAKTPGTRADIRRWARWSDFFFWVGLLLVLGGVAFVVWSVVTERDDRTAFWGVIAVTVVLVLACVAFGSHAGSRLSEARFADGHVTVGRIDEVFTHPGADGPDTYDIVVSAVLSSSVRIHRQIKFGVADLSDDDVGRAVRFRHNTLDPDDLDDVLFDGWQGWRGQAQRIARQSRALYADAHVSVGRVDEVMTYPGIPGTGDDGTTYSLMVSVDLPGPVTLRRTIHLGVEQLRSSGRRFGRTIRFRHNTLDPDDLFDGLFEGWGDGAHD